MTVSGFFLQVLATTGANIISFLLYQGVVNTGWFKRWRIKLTQDLGKLDPPAEQKYGET